MPSLGVEPATITPAAQTITQLTKWYGGAAARILQTQNGTAARPGGPVEIAKIENRKNRKFHIFYFLLSIFYFLFPLNLPGGGPGPAKDYFVSCVMVCA